MDDWEKLKSTFKHTEEEKEEMRVELELMRAVTDARIEKKLSQRKLSEISGIPKTTIARIETNGVTPQLSTLIKYLNAIGYRLKVEPRDNAVNTSKTIKKGHKNQSITYSMDQVPNGLMLAEDKEEYHATATIQKWGNGHGVRLSKEVLNDAKIKNNETVVVSVKDGRIIIEKEV